MDYKEIREKYPEFIYKNFWWKTEGNNLIYGFEFSVGSEYVFKPHTTIRDIDTSKVESIRSYIDSLVFNIGLVELLSYWKAFCSQKIIVNAGTLDEYQVNWWNKLLIKGMGQYFYENRIDFREEDFVDLVSNSTQTKIDDVYHTKSKRFALVPVGGGKDSSVTLELLKNNFEKIDAFLMNPSKAQIDTVSIAQVDSIEVQREIDPKLLELNNQGFLNGHTPFSALLSFTSLLVGVIEDYNHIVFSNEQSSNESNTEYLGMQINHQYSKSFEFENDFRNYNNRYLSDINYFSFLRPVYDIQIAKILSRYKKYIPVIRSCNVGQKTNSWCGKCSKCLSTFILFYPFFKEEDIRIFGKNLLEDESLKPLLDLLISDDNVKPFECVGTRHELRVALGLVTDESLIKSWNGNNNLPVEFEAVLKKEL